MGIRQSVDLGVVLKHVEQRLGYTKIYLWGRSMGAVTALKHLQRAEHSVRGAVLDSPFTDLATLVKEVVSAQTMLPEVLLAPLVDYFFDKVRESKGIDLRQSEVLSGLKAVSTPLALVVASDDQLIKNSHSQTIYQSLSCPKRIFRVCGGHNESRPLSLIHQCLDYLEHSAPLAMPSRRSSRQKPQRGLSLVSGRKEDLSTSIRQSIGKERPSSNYRRTGYISVSQQFRQQFRQEALTQEGVPRRLAQPEHPLDQLMKRGEGRVKLSLCKGMKWRVKRGHGGPRLGDG